MITSLAWLGLAIENAGAANDFYEPLLGSPRKEAERYRYTAGDVELRLQLPGTAPSGGEHVHYAYSTGPEGYVKYKDLLEALVPTEEHDLGVYRSVYGFDPDGHCIEFAERESAQAGIASLFEIVLEVDSISTAEEWYRRLNARVVDRGDSRHRVRLDMGPFELELWEPQRGIADARPGANVDVGLIVSDLPEAVERLRPGSRGIEETPDATRILDGDGHRLELYQAQSDISNRT